MVERIKELCAKNGTTIKALEKVLGLGNGTIRLWDEKRPSADKLYYVAMYFGVSMEYLLKGEDSFDSSKLSQDAMDIALIVDMLPPEVRRMLLLQVQALEQGLPGLGSAPESQESS